MEGVRKNSGSLVGARKELNFIEGSGITITITDSVSKNNAIDIQIDGSAGGAMATDVLWDAKGDVAVGTGANASSVLPVGTNGQVLAADSAQTLGVKWATLAGNIIPVVFAKSGTVSTSTGALRWYNDLGSTMTILSARASVGTAPSGQSLIVDVNVDGTTIYSTQGNRPTIAAAGNTAEGGTASTTTIADQHYLTVDVDQVGSGTAGSDLTVTVWLQG